MKKSRIGRPLAITKEKEEIIISMMADGMTQTKACGYVGISTDTLIRHKKKFCDFCDRLERAKLETTRLAHKSIKVGMIKDWRAAAWWLERTNPERFREKKEFEVRKPVLVEDMFSDNDNL